VWQVEWLTPLKKMFVKNANTNAQGGEHLLVLEHLQRRWSLSGSGIRRFQGSEMHIFH
jgi:hypothetical protein